ncbi:MAG: putative membrane protein [Glaciecola sp.]|jgi:putative membrane protein
MDNAQKFENDDWQKLSLISIAYFTASSIFKFANNFLYMLPIIALNFSKIKEQPLIILAVALAILVIFTFIGLLNYLFYKFRVTDERIEIKQGIFNKSHIDLPFERIQNVKLSQPLYYRISNYSCIELDTAGSAKQEAKIVALKTSQAEQLRIRVLETARDTHSIESTSTDENEADNSGIKSGITDEVVLNRRSIKDLIIHGITNNRIWIFLGALAPFYNSISDGLSQAVESIGFDIEAYFSLETQAWWEFGLHVLSLAMLIMLVIVLLSVVGAILMFYKYTLSKTKDRYIRRSGLLTKHEVSMKLSRIQLMVQAQDWLDVLLGRVNLSFEQNKSGTSNPNNRGEHMANKLLVPSVTVAESLALMKDAMPRQSLGDQIFKSISKRFILRGILLIVLPITGLLFAILPLDEIAPYFIIAVVSSLLTGLVVLRWKRWGYNFDSEHIYIRKGLLGVDYYCFPIYKAQQAQFKQSIFTRPHHLAGLTVVLASGSHKIPYMPADEVRSIVNSILDLLVTDKRSWM